MILVIIQLPRHTQAISAVSIWGTVIDPVLGAQKNYGNPCYYRRKSTTNHDHGQLHVVPLEYWWFCWSLDHIYNFLVNHNQSAQYFGTKAIMEIYVVPTEVDTATSTTMAN